jgi:hypothetical protein
MTIQADHPPDRMRLTDWPGYTPLCTKTLWIEKLYRETLLSYLLSLYPPAKEGVGAITLQIEPG